jgi:hypothetical protein
MSIGHCDSETLRAARPIDGAPRHEPAPCPEPAPRPELRARPEFAGYRLVCPGRSDIFLVDPEGFRRRIPSHSTYCRLFRDWRGIVDARDLFEIAQRPDLARSTLVIRGDGSGTLYLLDDGRKRLITSRAVIEKYWFNEDRISLVRQVLVDILPNGEIWE